MLYVQEKIAVQFGFCGTVHHGSGSQVGIPVFGEGNLQLVRLLCYNVVGLCFVVFQYLHIFVGDL